MTRSNEIIDLLSEERGEIVEQSDKTLQDHLSTLLESSQELKDLADRMVRRVRNAFGEPRYVASNAQNLYDMLSELESLSENLKSQITEFYDDRYVSK
jgi:hypothetical protein